MVYKKPSAKNTKGTNEKILFKDECCQMQGAIFDVYREMGCGFLEFMYQECLEKEFRKTESDHTAQVLNPLEATDMKLGLLVNFGYFPKAAVERIVL